MKEKKWANIMKPIMNIYHPNPQKDSRYQLWESWQEMMGEGLHIHCDAVHHGIDSWRQFKKFVMDSYPLKANPLTPIESLQAESDFELAIEHFEVTFDIRPLSSSHIRYLKCLIHRHYHCRGNPIPIGLLVKLIEMKKALPPSITRDWS
jgi:hypothetical protein